MRRGYFKIGYAESKLYEPMVLEKPSERFKYQPMVLFKNYQNPLKLVEAIVRCSMIFATA